MRSVEIEALPFERRAFIAARMAIAVDLCFAHHLDEAGFLDGTILGTLLERVTRAQDRLAFALECQGFLAGLRNAHTGFDDAWLWAAHGQRIGFHARPLAGSEWVVAESRVPALSPGDVLAEIDGEPFAAFFDRQARLLSASRRAGAEASLFFRPFLFPRAFTIATGDGRRVEVVRGAAAPLAPRELVEIRSDRGTCRLTIRDFSEAAQGRALALLDGHPGFERLLIDIRGNGGGSTPVRLMKRLIPGEFRLWSDSSVVQVGLERAMAALGEGLPPVRHHLTRRGEPLRGDPDAFPRPIVILQDALTASAAEDFILPFRLLGRARLVGETSAGSTGQPYVEDLGDGMTFSVAAKRCLYPSGAPFEGLGFVPDIEAMPTREGLAAGADPALEAALALLDRS